MNKYLTTLALIMLMLGLPASGKKNNAPNDSNLPGGALPGEFSVSATKTVHFSKGNLRQRINTNLEGDILYFESGWAENQYDLYYSDYQYLFTVEELEEELKFRRGEEGWRTLTRDEWDYLLGDSKERNNKYRLGVTVCDSPNCLIIAPDNFTGAIADSYNLSTWEKAESDGLVCLPAAGYENSELTKVGHFGLYWNYFGFGGSIVILPGTDNWVSVDDLISRNTNYKSL